MKPIVHRRAFRGKLLLLHISLTTVCTTPAIASFSCDSVFNETVTSAVFSDLNTHMLAQIPPALLARDYTKVPEIAIDSLIDLSHLKPAQKIESNDGWIAMNEFTFKTSSKGQEPNVYWARSELGDLFPWQNFDAVLKMHERIDQHVSPDVIWQYAAVNIPVLNFNSGVEFKIHFKTQETEEISRKLKTEVWFEHSLPKSKTGSIDWASLYLSNFRAVTSEGVVIENLKIKPESQIQFIGFSAKSEASEQSTAFAKIEISKSMTLQVSLPDSLNISDVIEKIDHGQFGKDTPLRQKFREMQISDLEMRKTLDLFFQSMKNPENQKWAKEIIHQGRDEIQKNLRQFGFSINNYKNPGGYFEEPVLVGKVFMSTVMLRVLQGIIPYEANEFGDLHGIWSHQAQILAGMKSLSPREVSIAHLFFVSYLAPRPEVWTLWNLLLDSRGEGVHGNRFWRDLLNTP